MYNGYVRLNMSKELCKPICCDVKQYNVGTNSRMTYCVHTKSFFCCKFCGNLYVQGFTKVKIIHGKCSDVQEYYLCKVCAILMSIPK